MNTELLTQNIDVVTQIALIAIFVTLIAILIAILTLYQNQAKKIDALKDELINFKLEMKEFKIEVKEEFTAVKIEIGGLKSEVSILSKLFGRFETDVKEVNARVNKVEEVQIQQVADTKTVKETVEKLTTVSENNSTRIKIIETENRNLMDKVLDVLTPKTTVLQK